MPNDNAADRVFIGQSILPMEPGVERVDAVAIRDGGILAAGDEASVLIHRGPKTEVTELGERALLPGFIDGHGHVAKLAANFGSANLAPPPVGRIETIDDLVAELRTHIAATGAAPGEWVQGRGYDPAFLAEGRHPTRADLDRVSQERPIYITHVSGHLSAANSLAIEMAGLNSRTPDPPGGVIRRDAATGEVEGVFEEAAMGFFTRGLIPPPTPETELERLKLAQETYAASGITTAQEGAMFPLEQALLERAANSNSLILDVVGYAFWATAKAALAGKTVGAYHGRFKLGGMKLMLDGSPQGKTAWLTTPYHEIPPGQPSDYCGYPAMPDEQAEGLAALAADNGWQIIAHCNGDAAADQFLRALAKAGVQSGARPVMIHAQTVREDQLDLMADMGVIPSFFASHIFYWGDYHRDSVLGPARAGRISPLASALKRGLRFNIHNDSPVVPPDMLRLVRCAVERRTRTGETLGGDQRISALDALAAVTRDAAYAHFDEHSRGTITPGKNADFVLLEADPTRVAPTDLESIHVLETIKDGVTIFRA